MYMVFIELLLIQVFGIPSKRMGEEVAAWVQIKEGETLTADEIKEFCKGNVRK